MRKLTCLLLLLSFATFLASCGRSDDESGLNEQSKSSEKSAFQILVEKRKFRDALKLVCDNKQYQLKCDNIRLDIRDDPEFSSGNYAITDKFGSITIYESAFSHKDNISEGWLAAIIGHELVHVKQGYSSISWAYLRSLWGDLSAQAALEVEGWGHMKDFRKRYNLSCATMLTIESNIVAYEHAKEHGSFPDETIDAAYNKILNERTRKAYFDCWNEKPVEDR